MDLGEIITYYQIHSCRKITIKENESETSSKDSETTSTSQCTSLEEDGRSPVVRVYARGQGPRMYEISSSEEEVAPDPITSSAYFGETAVSQNMKTLLTAPSSSDDEEEASTFGSENLSDSSSCSGAEESSVKRAVPKHITADTSSDDLNDKEEKVPPKGAKPAKLALKKESSSDDSSSEEDEPAVKSTVKKRVSVVRKDEGISPTSEKKTDGKKRKGPKKKSSSEDSSSDDDEPPSKKSALAPATVKGKAKSDSNSVSEPDADCDSSKNKWNGLSFNGVEQRGTPANKFIAHSVHTPNSSNKRNTPFRRVRDEDVEIDERVKDMSFEAKKNAAGSWGERANRDLKYTRGKSFKHEKTKKKRGSYRGGPIDMAVNSIKFD